MLLNILVVVLFVVVCALGEPFVEHDEEDQFFFQYAVWYENYRPSGSLVDNSITEEFPKYCFHDQQCWRDRFQRNVRPSIKTHPFIQSGFCVENKEICGVTCQGFDIPVRKLLLTPKGRPRVFLAIGENHSHTTSIMVTICGPRTSRPGNRQDISLSYHTYSRLGVLNLGNLDPNSWVGGTYDDVQALQATFVNGDWDSSCPEGGKRYTNVVFACDIKFANKAPSVKLTLLSPCQCKQY